MSERSPLRVGIGGPVGSGKTALTLNLCQALRNKYNMAVVTNDIYTKEDSNFLTRNEAMSPDRIVGVETGGCPHTAIREDASINLAAIDDLCEKFDGLELIIIESGGDNLAATFSPELSDLTLYVIDVAGGEKIPRKGGPGMFLSQPGNAINESYHCAPMMVSIESAIKSRDWSEYDIPSVPMLIPSLTPTELNRIPTSPSATTAFFTSRARSSKCILQVLPSYQILPMPTCPLFMSSAVIPVP